MSFKGFRALKLSKSESLRAIKFSQHFLTYKLSNFDKISKYESYRALRVNLFEMIRALKVSINSMMRFIT